MIEKIANSKDYYNIVKKRYQIMDRLNKWITYSHKLAKIEPFMVPVVQGLGRLDVKIINYEDRFIKVLIEKPTIEDSLQLTDCFTYSYLWVLGTYEIIRTMDQRCGENANLLDRNLNNSIKNLKYKFERIRIPLAKMEPAKRHKDTDSRIAYPALHPDLGISWRISEKEYIARRELSDDFLSLIEKL